MTAPAAAAESRRIEFSARRDVELLLRILAVGGAAVFVAGVFLAPARASAARRACPLSLSPLRRTDPG